MPREKSTRELVDLLGRRLGNATLAFHNAVAGAVGLSVTENKALAALEEAGSLTAGELSRQLGLTSGAVTGLIDRLAAAKLAKRVADPDDRRRVMVEPVRNARRTQRLAKLKGPMGEQIRALIAGYSSAEQQLLFDFMTRAGAILESAAAELRRR